MSEMSATGDHLDVDRDDVLDPTIEAIDALFDEDLDRTEAALLEALGQTRKLEERQRGGWEG